jgi:hypothetical protein
MRHTTIAAVLLICSALPAHGQDKLARIARALGDTVEVTEGDGVVVSGVLSKVTDRTIMLASRELPLDGVLKIDRRGDPIWDGALIGAGVGLAVSSGVAEVCLHESRPACALGPVAFYSAMGALWDKLHVGRTTIYRRRGARAHTAVVPFASARATGVAVRWSF